MSMGADAAKVAVVQMSRVIFLVTILPWIIVWEQGGVPRQLQTDQSSTATHAVRRAARERGF
jgi:uncharacterized membrane protein AbrB (regulator of aidB expression)